MKKEDGAGRVYLVGAGPGSIDLVTVRALELIKQADVIIYDYLVNPAMLDRAGSAAELIYVGKTASAHTLTQDEINALLVEKAGKGKVVVRLKGGDPYVFGRGGEEGIALAQAGVFFEVVPGVSSAIAAASYAGIPVTHRNLASQVTFITGHEDPTKPESAIDWAQLARLNGTRVFLMGIERLRSIAGQLLAQGALTDTPVALVRWGTTARQETLTGTLETIADLAEKHQFKPPAVTIIGEVVNLRDQLNWFEKLPLFGQRVVVARARQQASGLSGRLARLGADVLEIPTIRIVPVELSVTQREQLAIFGRHFDWLVFSSPNGVERFFSLLERDKIDIRALGSVKIAALGPATASQIEKYHLRVELQPSLYTSEALGAAFSAEKVKSRRFCLPQGSLADPALAGRLVEQGAEVAPWVLYDTQPETDDVNGAKARFKNEGAHWVVFTSASTVQNWHRLDITPGAGSSSPRPVSIGPVTSSKLRQLGYGNILESPVQSLDSIVETILHSHI